MKNDPLRMRTPRQRQMAADAAVLWRECVLQRTLFRGKYDEEG